MKLPKLLLGLGAMCAVCCAGALLGLAGGLSAFGAALWACADEFMPAALVLLALAAGMVALKLWKQRTSSPPSACGCTAIRTGDQHAGS